MSFQFTPVQRTVEQDGISYVFIDAESEDPVAAGVGGHWVILSDDQREQLLAAEGDAARALLMGWPAAPLLNRGGKPELTGLAVEGYEVVGLWVHVPEPKFAGGTGKRSKRRRAPRQGNGERIVAADEGAFPMDVEDVETVSTAEAEPPTAGAEPPAEQSRTVERVPHLDAPERIAKAPGTELAVRVYADTEAMRAGESGEGVSVTLPAGVDSVDVAVLLQVTPHFEVVGDQFGEVTIAEAEPRSNVCEFKLRVTAEAPDAEAGIGVLFNYRGRSCGYVARAWRWDAAGEEAVQAEAQPAAPASMPVHADADQPDLSVFVTAPLNDGVHYQCAITTPHLDEFAQAKVTEEFAVPEQGYAFLEKLLDALTAEDRTPVKRLRALTEIGHETFEAAPPLFKRVLWAMVDAGKRPETIYIASAEPMLTWELMIPRRFDGKAPDELGPLGTEFSIGRWTRGDSVSPPPELPVDRAFVIAPEYEPDERWLDASAEIDFISDRLNGERVEPATSASLDARFASDHAALLHFVCHGAAGVTDDDAVWLDSDEELRAREMETLQGFKKLCRAKRPLVFMNSCETGRTVPSLGGGSGFPRSFGNIGASAVIAPLWPVDDRLATKIALDLYEAALQPDAPPIAAILRDMRKRGYEAQDVDEFAAYCFYGDPLARLKLTGG